MCQNSVNSLSRLTAGKPPQISCFTVRLERRNLTGQIDQQQQQLAAAQQQLEACRAAVRQAGSAEAEARQVHAAPESNENE